MPPDESNGPGKGKEERVADDLSGIPKAANWMEEMREKMMSK